MFSSKTLKLTMLGICVSFALGFNFEFFRFLQYKWLLFFESWIFGYCLITLFFSFGFFLMLSDKVESNLAVTLKLLCSSPFLTKEAKKRVKQVLSNSFGEKNE